ncbi:MAG: hypothetical protein AAFR90_08755 [Pseudomonadota bacterium]
MAKTLEERVTDLEEVYEDIPHLVNIRFDRVDRDIAVLKMDVASLKDRMDALPRAIAELLDEKK